MATKTPPEFSLVDMTPEESAEYANLRYVHDDEPGLTRKKHGKGFAYYSANGKRLEKQKDIERINSLAIPPAYTDVWICRDANGHLQATGLNAQGQKQYIYHPRWRQVRDEMKFNQMILFGELLPALRARVKKDISSGNGSLTRQRVLAAVVWLLDRTHIRVGNDEYARANDSYGLTTIRKKHVDVEDNEITFDFSGKSGQDWHVSVENASIAEIVQTCAETPGYELFKYLDQEGNRRDVTSEDVNSYLKEISGNDITAKFFRTWAGTVKAVEALYEFRQDYSEKTAKKHVTQAIKKVAEQLGNTPSVCRKCYVHPDVIETYLECGFDAEIAADNHRNFSRIEATTLTLLKRRFAKPQR